MINDGRTDEEFGKKLKILKNLTKEILCKLQLLQLIYRLVKKEDVRREDVPVELKPGLRSKQILRNIIVMKNYKKILHSLYDVLKELHQRRGLCN